MDGSRWITFVTTSAVEVLDGGDWIQTMAAEHIPNSGGTVFVNLRQYLRGIFSPVPPSLGGIGIDTSPYPLVARRFRVISGTLTGTPCRSCLSAHR
ncbi:MAG: hypothetical protein WDO15_11480 [Bacteroidota bacterium]